VLTDNAPPATNPRVLVKHLWIALESFLYSSTSPLFRACFTFLGSTPVPSVTLRRPSRRDLQLKPRGEPKALFSQECWRPPDLRITPQRDSFNPAGANAPRISDVAKTSVESAFNCPESAINFGKEASCCLCQARLDSSPARNKRPTTGSCPRILKSTDWEWSRHWPELLRNLSPSGCQA
jgi:hypothetical protein